MGALQIAVVGSGLPDTPVAGLAEEVGRLLGEAGCTVVCGGLRGVMEAVARGARSAGGVAIGILPGESRHDANPWVAHAIATGMGHARNLAVVASGDAVIAIGGGWGTASEVALARKLGRPVVLLGEGPDLRGEGILRAASAAEAVRLAIELAGRDSG
jgi:uncharacterized protein (TIGR00725 family)